MCRVFSLVENVAKPLVFLLQWCQMGPSKTKAPSSPRLLAAGLKGKTYVGWLRNLVNVIVVPFELVLMSFKGMGESLVIKGDD